MLSYVNTCSLSSADEARIRRNHLPQNRVRLLSHYPLHNHAGPRNIWLKAMYKTRSCVISCPAEILIAERQREKIPNNYFPWISFECEPMLLWCHAGSSATVSAVPGDQKIRAGEKVELLGNFGGTAPITCTWLKFKKPVRKRTESLYNDRSTGSQIFWNKGNYLQWFLTAPQINFPREHRVPLYQNWQHKYLL